MMEYDDFPELTAYIHEMAQTGEAPGDWEGFLWTLNDALGTAFITGGQVPL